MRAFAPCDSHGAEVLFFTGRCFASVFANDIFPCCLFAFSPAAFSYLSLRKVLFRQNVLNFDGFLRYSLFGKRGFLFYAGVGPWKRLKGLIGIGTVLALIFLGSLGVALYTFLSKKSGKDMKKRRNASIAVAVVSFIAIAIMPSDARTTNTASLMQMSSSVPQASSFEVESVSRPVSVSMMPEEEEEPESEVGQSLGSGQSVTASVAQSQAGQSRAPQSSAARASDAGGGAPAQEAPAQAQPEQPAGGNMVWIPRTGSKYHSYASCSNMQNPTQVTEERAIALGYGRCKKCW